MLAAGAWVDRYEVERLLGEGSTAHVYLVRHRRLGSAHVLNGPPAELARLHAAFAGPRPASSDFF